MDKINPKLCIIITRDGVESVTVHASDVKSRQAGYKTCVALEAVLEDVNRVIGELYGSESESEQVQ